MHQVYQCTSKHPFYRLILLPVTSNLPLRPLISRQHLYIYEAHAYILRGHQPNMHQEQKTLAKSTNILCALHSLRVHPAPLTFPTPTKSSKPCLRRTSQPLPHRHHKNRNRFPQSPSRASDSPRGRVAIAFQRCINGAYV